MCFIKLSIFWITRTLITPGSLAVAACLSLLSASTTGAAIKSAGILTTVSEADITTRACHLGVAGHKLIATYIVTSLAVHNRRLVSRSINGHLFILIGYK